MTGGTPTGDPVPGPRPRGGKGGGGCCWKEGFQYLVSNSCSCSFSLAKPRGSLPRWSLEYLVSAKSTLGQHSTKDVSVPGSSQNTTHNMMAYAQLLVHQTGIGKSTLPPRVLT